MSAAVLRIRPPADGRALIADCGQPAGGPWLLLLVALALLTQLLAAQHGDMNRRGRDRANGVRRPPVERLVRGTGAARTANAVGGGAREAA